MGFQNNINSALGIAAGALTAGKHLKKETELAKATEAQADETKALKEEQAIANKINALNTDINSINEAQDTSDRVKALGEESKTLNADYDATQAEIDSIKPDKNGRLRTSKGQFYSQKALQEMVDLQTDRVEQMKRLTINMELSKQKMHDLNELRDINNKLLGKEINNG